MKLIAQASAPLLALGLASIAASTPACAADAPAPYDPRSTAAAPCGTGTPPPGHEMPEIRPGTASLSLTVRQDGSRLCYVAGGIADAPVIRVRPGQPLTVTLRNEITSPADIDAATASGKLGTPNDPVPQAPGYYRVIPGTRHAATGATNLHVHGFAVPPVAPQDDVLSVCTDPASGPAGCGQREFTYRYQVPAALPEGLYWYHPHQHGEVHAQMLMGQAGAIVVEGPQADAFRAAGIADRVLVVRQTQDQDAGKTPDASMTAAAPGMAPGHADGPPANAIDTAHELLCTSTAGIDQLSLNGTPILLGDVADTRLARYEIPAGGRQLWRILNAATDAFLDLNLVDEAGRPRPLEVVARDGAPLADDAGRRRPAERTVAALSVPPSGRLEVLVDAPPPGRRAYLVTHAVDTGCAGDRLPERRLAMAVAGPPPATRATPPAPPRSSAARHGLFEGLLARKTGRVRTIAMAEYPRPGSADQTDFYIVERRPGAVLKPYAMGDAPAITVRAGTTEEWVIENWTNELHTFHIHQLHFRVLEIDGEPVREPPLLDVVEVPYATAGGYRSADGPVRPGRVRVKMSFPAALAGDIPFHCHLVDHEDNGMMAVLRVLRPDGRAVAPAHGGMRMSAPRDVPVARPAPRGGMSRPAEPDRLMSKLSTPAIAGKPADAAATAPLRPDPVGFLGPICSAAGRTR